MICSCLLPWVLFSLGVSFGGTGIDRYMQSEGGVWVDPFSGKSEIAQIRNDLNPAYGHRHNQHAVEFVESLQSGSFDHVLFDPPYSPRQISECYKSVGLPVTGEDTQNSRLYRQVKDGLSARMEKGGVVISFGWNSQGFGKTRGFEIVEILLCAHGGAHNDTICTVERKIK